MQRPLPTIHELITFSWQQYWRHWKDNSRIVAWILLLPLIQLAIIWPLTRLDFISAFILYPLFAIAHAIIILWVTIRLNRHILRQDESRKDDPHEGREAWRFFLPQIWIKLLSDLAILGGFILLIVPGFWLMGNFMFANLLLLDQNLHGTRALAASQDLIRGRWWATISRFVIPSICFGLLLAVCLLILRLVLDTLFGAGTFSISNAGSILSFSRTLNLLANSFIVALFLPLFATLQVRLYHALRADKE